MGSVADKIARKVAAQIRSNVIDLSTFRSSRSLAEETGLDGSRMSEMIAEGYDPGFAYYAQNLVLVSLFAEAISQMAEGRGYVNAVAKAEDEYVPDGPPISPLTASYFNMWSLFDLQFGASRETIGTCTLRVAEVTGMPKWIGDVVRPMQQSRMGFYLHVGLDGPLVLLKDILTQQVHRCQSVAGYQGQAGQLWFVRLMPPPNAMIEHDVVVTTPYVILDGTEQQFRDYIDRELGRISTQSRRPVGAEMLLKHGPTVNHWHEYIFLGYVNHQADAIFLTGVPDIPGSLPHA